MTDSLFSPERRSTVWLLEDSPLEAGLALRVLSPEFHVELFADGATASEALSTSATPPDVILADWALPAIDGLEFCRIVRQQYDELALPVIMVTSREGREIRLEALDAGVNDIIQKPFDPQELRARVRVLARIRRLHQRSNALETALQLFIGTVSHDLRTPLHAIKGYASLMSSREDLPETHRKWADRIDTISGRMGRMLNELIEVTQIRGGAGIRLERSVTRLNDIVTMVIEEVQIAHPYASFDVSVQGDNEGLWDADRLARVVQNLASNAALHGDAGSRVSVRVRETAHDSVVEVHNSGAPVPEELRGSLYDPFRRGRPSRTGLGLGLYITRELVKAHGGEVSFTSSVEEGTTFTVTLPRTVAPATGSQARPLA